MYPKSCQTYLIVKPGLLLQAQRIFKGTNIKIVDGGDRESGGQRDLGAAIGSESFVVSYVKEKVQKWSAMVERLAQIATTERHASLATFVFGLRHKWRFCQGTRDR